MIRISPVKFNTITPAKTLTFSSKKVKKPDNFYLNKELVGSCFIERKNFLKEKVQANIYKIERDKSFKTYVMEKDGEILGDMDIDISKDDTIFIANIEAYKRHKYKGIGTNLLQVAVEESMRYWRRGKIYLNAKPLHAIQKHPAGFYRKMGFKEIKTDEVDKAIYGTFMRLDAYKNGFWIQKIRDGKISDFSVSKKKSS